jgi:hypothetical protein
MSDSVDKTKEDLAKLYEVLKVYGDTLDEANRLLSALKGNCKVIYDETTGRSTVYVTDQALEIIDEWIFNYKMLAEFSNIKMSNTTVH